MVYAGNDSMPQQDPAIDATLKRIREDALAETRLRKRLLEKAEAELRNIDQFISSYERGWPAHLQWIHDQQHDHFSALGRQDPEIAKVIEALADRAKRNAMDSLKRFPGDFEKECAQAGIDVDRTSRHPRYRVCQGFIEVEVAEGSLEVRIGDREGPLEKIPCDVGAVVEAIQRHNRRLFGRKFDSKTFLGKLYRQYKAILVKRQLTEGEGIPLRSITHRLGKNVKGFRTDAFLVDLSQLIRKGPLVIEGRQLDLQHTKDDKQGMLLHGFENRGYVGFISFRKEATR